MGLLWLFSLCGPESCACGDCPASSPCWTRYKYLNFLLRFRSSTSLAFSFITCLLSCSLYFAKSAVRDWRTNFMLDFVLGTLFINISWYCIAHIFTSGSSESTACHRSGSHDWWSWEGMSFFSSSIWMMFLPLLKTSRNLFSLLFNCNDNTRNDVISTPFYTETVEVNCQLSKTKLCTTLAYYFI